MKHFIFSIIYLTCATNAWADISKIQNDTAMPITTIGDLTQDEWKVRELVYLGHDEFFVPSTKGPMLWNAVTNTLTPLKDDYFGQKKIVADLVFGNGRLLVAPSGEGMNLVWWSSQSKTTSEPFYVSKNEYDTYVRKVPRIDDTHLLICTGIYGHRINRARILSLKHSPTTNKATLEWSHAPELREKLKAAGIIGPVEGMQEISANEVSTPAMFNTKICDWDIKNTPAFLARDGKISPPQIAPHFLADGRTLISAVYHSEECCHLFRLNPPLLWNPKTLHWDMIEPTFGPTQYGGEINDSGPEGPVVSFTFGEDIPQFLDTKTMQWLPSTQRIAGVNSCYFYLIGALSNGQAIAYCSTGGIRETLYRFEPKRETLAEQKNQGATEGALPDAYRKCSEVKLRNGGSFFAGSPSVMLPPGKKAKTAASLSQRLDKHSAIELADGSILVFGGSQQPREPSTLCSGSLDPGSCASTLHYIPAEDRWEPVPELNIPYAWSGLMLTGPNQYDVRRDAITRHNGDFVYLTEWQNQHNDDGEEKWMPEEGSHAYTWQLGKGVKPLGKLLQARVHASLLELNDNRLAVMGGDAQLIQIAHEKTCQECPNTFSALGPIDKTRTTEVYDDKTQQWLPGPLANHSGGMAFKLNNGRVFKLYCTGYYYERGFCQSEIADAAFTQWQVAPQIPVEFFSLSEVAVVGNRVLVLGNRTKKSKQVPLGGGLTALANLSDYTTAVWDDDLRQWLVWQQWTNDLGSPEQIMSITPLPGNKEVRIRYRDSFKTVLLPTE